MKGTITPIISLGRLALFRGSVVGSDDDENWPFGDGTGNRTYRHTFHYDRRHRPDCGAWVQPSVTAIDANAQNYSVQATKSTADGFEIEIRCGDGCVIRALKVDFLGIIMLAEHGQNTGAI